MRLLSRILGRGKEEFEQELQAHLQMAIRDRVERGESPEEARVAAMRELGNIPLIKDVTRETWGWIWLERLVRNLRYAFRQLGNSPGFGFSVIGTLALGLGATAAMFTVVDRVLLRPLPYEDPHRLLEIKEAGKRGAIPYGAPFLDLQQWRERSHTLDELAYYTATGELGHRLFLEGTAGVELVNSPAISANLFATLGVRPAMGRGFEAKVDNASVQPGDASAIILSDAVWRDAYGGDAKILGKTVKLSGESCTVVGVMPRGFTFPFGLSAPLVWRPLILSADDTTRTAHARLNYQVIARLKPRVRLPAAEAELKVIQAAVAKAYTDPYEREGVRSIKLQEYGASLVSGEVKKALLALLGASGVLWLIACMNVTSLSLARSTARQREIAVRGALGASRWQIIQQLLIEGAVLSVLASLLGLGLAILTLKLFEHGLTTQFNIHVSLAPNLSVMSILLGLTVASALLSSVWPAIAAASASIEPALRQGTPQAGAGGVQYRTRALLVVAQITMSLTLLVGCGLLLRTIYELRHVALGFRTDHVIVANMAIPSYKFVGRDLMTELYQPLVERVRQLQGVQSAALVTEVPLGKTFQMMYSFGGTGNSADDVRRRELRSQFRAVDPEMQKVFGFTMLRGRFFNAGDTPGSQPVVVVNRAFVKAYTGSDGDPGKMLGQTLVDYSKDRRAIVVGILNDERQMSVAEQAEPEIEVCLPQIRPDTGFYNFAEGMAMALAVRVDRSPSLMIPQLRALMRSASPELEGSNFSTMEQVVEDSYGNQQLAARLFEVFGGAALLLCVSGIYSLLAYLVTQRTRELGLRIALGAQRGNVMWLVLRQAAWMLVAGSILGLVLAYLSSLLLRTFLYAVPPHDPWTMGAVTLLLLGAGLGAAYLPARRAAGVNPMEALRGE